LFGFIAQKTFSSIFLPSYAPFRQFNNTFWIRNDIFICLGKTQCMWKFFIEKIGLFELNQKLKKVKKIFIIDFQGETCDFFFLFPFLFFCFSELLSSNYPHFSSGEPRIKRKNKDLH